MIFFTSRWEYGWVIVVSAPEAQRCICAEGAAAISISVSSISKRELQRSAISCFICSLIFKKSHGNSLGRHQSSNRMKPNLLICEVQA